MNKDDKLKKILELIREYAKEEKVYQISYSNSKQKESISFSYCRRDAD